MGKGKKVRLWTDFWSKAGILKDLFPTLNSIAVNKIRLLADYLSNAGSDSVQTGKIADAGLCLQHSVRDTK